MPITDQVRTLLSEHLEAQATLAHFQAARREAEEGVNKAGDSVTSSLGKLGAALYNAGLLDVKTWECVLETGGRCYLVTSADRALKNVREVRVEREPVKKEKQ